MTKKGGKNNVLRYTARIVPKTLKATKNVRRIAFKKIDNIFISTTKSIKNIASRLNRGVAHTIKSITRRKGRK